MGLNVRQLRDLVVRPVLGSLALVEPGADSPDSERLILGTAAIESSFEYLHQEGSGPALGLWQMEPTTHVDIWVNFLAFKPQLAAAVSLWRTVGPHLANQLIWNLAYACAMARVHYMRDKHPIPSAMADMDAYYDRVYNAGGASRPGEFTSCYARLVEPFVGN
jgi:hypothetical protein